MQQWYSGPNAFGAQGEAGVLIVHDQPGLVGDGAGVDARIHPVDSDTVASFAMVDRPAGGVESGVAGQRAWMKIEAPEPWCCDRIAGQDGERMHVEKQVDLLPPDSFGKA